MCEENQRISMRIDLEVLNSVDHFITTSKSDSECVSEAEEQMLNVNVRAKRKAADRKPGSRQRLRGLTTSIALEWIVYTSRCEAHIKEQQHDGTKAEEGVGATSRLHKPSQLCSIWNIAGAEPQD